MSPFLLFLIFNFNIIAAYKSIPVENIFFDDTIISSSTEPFMKAMWAIYKFRFCIF